MTYCKRCSRTFTDLTALQQHKRDSGRHNQCHICSGRDYATWDGLESHWINSPRHFYCQFCEEHFDDDDELDEHDEEEHYYCDSCDSIFPDEVEHNSQNHHYCIACRRLFSTEHGLRCHLNSSIHVGRTIKCGCPKAFTCKSALLQHMESGGCASGMTRHRLNDAVTTMDRSNVITNAARLIGGLSQPIETWATEKAWNGAAYECYFCHSTFRSLTALNQHLQSPRHEEKIYFCPKHDCKKEFTTLSGLCQHVESGSCGVLRFREVQAVMDSLVRGMKRLTAY